jgi:hypothetical protein
MVAASPAASQPLGCSLASRRAVVLILCVFDPASGSVIAKAIFTVPSAIPLR